MPHRHIRAICDFDRTFKVSQWSGQPAFPALALIRCRTVDFWIMYKHLQIHAMRATFHIVFPGI
eukprot:COSAG01_NODE_57399_length_312_cov_1.211268_1_plen_63_part_01